MSERYFTVRGARCRPTTRRNVWEVHTDAMLEHERRRLGIIVREHKHALRWADVAASQGRSGKMGTAATWGEAVEALKLAAKEG